MVGSQGDVPLVGRERELAVLLEAVAGAADSTPGAVLVAAEAGGGKSRLVRELLVRSTGPTPLVLRAQCVDVGDPGLPFLAMVDLVRAIEGLAAHDAELVSVLDRHPVAAGLIDPIGSGDAVDESRRLQLFDATAALLADAGRLRGPVVVVVEDLQWVDASSADFLRFLLSRMTAARLVVVATVRTDGLAARPRIRQLLGELARLPSVRRLDLEPFDEAEVAEYLTRTAGGNPAPDVAADVLRRTGGNPFYVETLAAAPSADGDREIPRALADLLVGRVDALPEQARTVVRCAAVAGHVVPDRLLRQVAGLGDAELDEALRVAVAEGVLVPDGAGYSFGHDLLREAVYGDLLPGERARLHAAHAAALEADGSASAAEVAHHFTEAQDPPGLLAWSVRAADEATRLLAPAEALQHLERALAAWPKVDGAASLAGSTHGQVAVRAARAARLAGLPSRATELAGRAVELCDAGGDGAGGIEARAELTRALVEGEAADRGVPVAEEAVRMAEDSEPGSAALAHAVLARVLLAERRTDEARPVAERALVEARATGASALEVEALTTAAFLDDVAGDRAAAADRLGTALRLARSAGELTAELRAHYSLASVHYYNGDVAGSLPVLRAAMARVTESGLRWSNPGIELRLLSAVALYVSGDLDGSLKATQAPESPPPDVAAARLAAVSCYAAVAGGLPDAAPRLAALRQSWDIHPQVALLAGGCESDHRAWEGDFSGAVATAERAQSHLDAVEGEGMYGGLWLSAIGLGALADAASYCRQRRDDSGTAAAVRQGDVLMERVARIIEGGHGRPGELGPEGRAWYARAVAEHGRLQGEPAVDQWQQALEAFGYGHVYEQARCRWRLADALVAAGDRDGARVHAVAAAAAAGQMQAAPLQRAVAATISRARLAGAATAADAVLTAREREVLALVAEGMTNREIGKRLFISEKTASVHLSNLMAKLNVTSRTEAVTVAHRRGLLDVL
ncbi:helix-turn-helix transcriptional regulator [Nocardioides bizhenqiangii]|uniref:AAA family ATPase n=1 Tax=Nocardioides bizhenqiangii TaxID=3095076 RepID=A0ABZ0ZM93_9ACTN|nr:AAA family ATPase [Nocardioides sp. HM61]WQQ25323.1 AAA family ATPase [Nocardioides sp. HM61]